jgi:hypothetical protein
MSHQNQTYGNTSVDHYRTDRIPGLAVLPTGHGCKIGKTTQRESIQVSCKKRALILDSLGKVVGESFAAYCIRVFVNSAHLKTDLELMEMIAALQDQISDNEKAMRRVLGGQFEFIRDVKMG